MPEGTVVMRLGPKISDMREALERAGRYAWFPVKGHYGGENEKSYLVYNISLKEDMLYLARKYGQKAVIYIKDGNCQYWEQDDRGRFKMTHEKPIPTLADMSDAEALFMQVSRAFEFPIPFFDGSDGNASEFVRMNGYVCDTINKRFSNEREANRRLDKCLTDPSGYNRYANRGTLYGNNFHWET